ncbi:general substrate transporter [Testicularia cyperi]|uniref:General substrate transporter n=1 Tax=Testicularia cyperi TaxID=1882483 RepID=A0A317XSC4_9BASI|nr:general substrate transporter [Testicularia cyperi]
MALSPSTYTLLCGCFVALGSILFGYDLGVIAGVLTAPDFKLATGNPDDNYVGFIVSALTLGAFCGCIPASMLADRFSRRMAIFVASLIFLMGGSIQTAAKSGAMMLAGRFFAGFAIGMLALLAPLYQSEIARAEFRGRLTTLQQFFLGLGAFIASFITFGTSLNQNGTAFQWRFPLGLQMAPCVPLAALIWFFPESPRWLIINGRDEEGRLALAKLHARGDINDAYVVAEYNEIKADVLKEKSQQPGWKVLVKDSQAVRKVMIGIIIQFSVQMTGVSAIQYYSPQILGAFGFTATKTLLFQALSQILALIGELCCILFIDRLGRRWPLIICNMATGATFVVGAALLARYPVAADGSVNMGAAGAFIAMTWLFQFFFSFAIGPLSWAIPVEIFNTNIRAKGTAITSMACWIANFMIGQVTPIALTNVGWRYYMLFAICGFTNALTFYLILPETKGRTLEEMDDYFAATHWIVPLSKTQPRSVSAVRAEIGEGIYDDSASSEKKNSNLNLQTQTLS